MALTYVIDTSVLVRLTQAPVRAVVEPLVLAGSVARCTLTDLELGAVARSEVHWDTVAASLAVFDAIEVTMADLRRALQVQRLLAERHGRGRKIPTLVAAAVGERAGATLLHYDRDFELIARVTGQAHRWVVRSGSVD
jgi:predicted nucleic acid-binding protein